MLRGRRPSDKGINPLVGSDAAQFPQMSQSAAKKAQNLPHVGRISKSADNFRTGSLWCTPGL